jgi:hypothetical protein
VPQAFELVEGAAWIASVVVPITGGLVAAGQDFSGSGKGFLHVAELGAMLPATRFQLAFAQRDLRDLHAVAPSDPQTDLVVVGRTTAGKAWVARIDAAGAPVWEVLLLDDAVGASQLNAAAAASDGGTLAVGSHALHGLFVKLGPTGGVVCQKQIGGAGEQALLDVTPAPDGGAVAVGQAGLDAWAVKLTAACAVEWSVSIAGPGDDLLLAVTAAPGGGWLAGGGTRSYGAGDLDAWLVKLDAAGAIALQRTYGGAGFDQAAGIAAHGAGAALLGGTASAGAGLHDILLVTTDADGAPVARRTYGTAAAELGVALARAGDGGLWLGGTSPTSSLAVRTDAAGEVALCAAPDVGKDAPGIAAGTSTATASANGFTATDLAAAAKPIASAGESFAGEVKGLCPE